MSGWIVASSLAVWWLPPYVGACLERSSSMRFPALSAAFVAFWASALLLVSPADAANPTAGLAAHRALYDLTLANARDNDVIAARGTMGYEVIDACDGWAVR